MEIKGIKPVMGLTGLQALFLDLDTIEELLTGYEPPEVDVEIDIDGAKAYAIDHDISVCDMTNEEKSRFIRFITK